jgi:hypothetical protein
MSNTTSQRSRLVALVGSSGGGTATLGHTDPSEFFRIIQQELDTMSEPVHLSCALFVALNSGGMDFTKQGDSATLYQISGDTQRQHYGSLEVINERVQEMEKELARDIEEGKIHGLISVSCKVSLFSNTLQAAADKQIPMTGTGGSSLSLAAATYKLHLVGNAGGSVATTSRTRAISYCFALAQDWKLHYAPWKAKSKKTYPTWKSVLNSCLPAFWGVALCKRLLLAAALHDLLPEAGILLEALESFALPTACAVVMASSRRNSSNVIMGAVLASMACRRSILGGLLAGYFVAFFEERLLYLCILRWNVPATMSNLLTTGLVGVFVATLLVPVAGYLREITHWARTVLILAIVEPRQDEYENLRIIGLALLGFLFCYGSKVGWYHSLFLPIILIEMELGDASIFGAMDQLTLVLVSAGICAGKYIVGGSDLALVRRGLAINLLCGDFIEACYPFMEEHILINLGGYLASGWSVSMLTSECKSSAYLPFPIAILLAEDWSQIALASLIAMGIPFVATVVNHFLVKSKANKLE